MSTHTTSSPPSSRRRRRGPVQRRPPRPSAAAPADPAAPTYEPCAFDPTAIPFDRLSLDDRLLSGIRDLGWSDTRPVQSGVIPLALDGGDVIACAETGTGKTAAFLIPILQRFLTADTAAHEAATDAAARDAAAAAEAQTPETMAPDVAPAGSAAPGATPGPGAVAAPGDAAIPGGAATRALVLAPTRELAVQIEDQVQGLTYHTSISSVAVYGGVPMDPQERALRAGADIVVATPGRLMDHMRHGSTNFSRLEILVLDEADRMLDMGFWPDVRRILEALPPVRQTLLFSATMPAEVLQLTREFLRGPRYIQVGRQGGPASTITHAVQMVPALEKTQWLARWLRDEAMGPVLVFCRTKIGAERLASRLSGMGIRTAALHADRTQQQRTAAVEGFRTGTYRVLVATDVAARGLDIDGIAHVVNFEVPDTPEAYVHRVGRTGRAEATGSALTLAAPEELRALRALEKAVGVQLQ